MPVSGGYMEGRPIVPIVLEYRGHDCYARRGSTIYVTDTDNKQDKIEEIWELFPVISRVEICEEEWEQEVQRRLAEYPRLNYEYEQSCMRAENRG